MVKLCKIDGIKIGEKKRFKVEGKEILTIRLEDGFYAVDNRCSHAGFRLSFLRRV
jgi:nitrite reductase/ring-hydroxylating ferredoxin subunit